VCNLPAERRPPSVDLAQRDVKTGLSNDQVIEIVAGLDDQTCVYVEGIDARIRIFENRGPPGGRNREP
jgi:HlyD family secretion protein